MADLIHSSPQRVRFGAFEADLRAGELWKSGRRRKLTGQPFSVLAILLERPGEVVSREELQKRLWPDTFVDVDHNLNAAINKIREALDDSPERPRFVETLSRRGYRFIAPVEIVKPVAPAPNGTSLQPSPATEPAAGSGDGASPPVDLATSLSETPPIPAVIPKRRNWPRILLWPAAVVATVMLLAALAWLFRPALPPPALSDYTQLTHDGKRKYLIGTDGPRLYFREGIQPAQMSVNGETEAPVHVDLPGTKLYQVSSVSPDGSKLLIAQLSGLSNASVPMWSVPTLGGSPVRLADILGIAGAWSPDGQKLVYVRGNALYLANADGTESRQLASLPGPLAGPNVDSSEGQGVVTSPAWSPDGKAIGMTLVTSKSRISQLWEVSADGTNLHEMFPGWHLQTAVCCGSWTPDGKYFIFESGGQIWAARQTGSLPHKGSREPVQLTSGAISYAYPIPSNDGKTIFAVEAIRRGELQRYDLGKKQFEPILGGISAQDVAFSKDREWVAYATYPDGILWRRRVDGSDRLQLSFPPVYALLPRWSPDGTELVYFGLEKGRPARIYEVSASGGTPQQLMPNGNGNQADPNWSPDGSRLLFGGTGANASSIQVLDLQTRQISKVPGSDGMYSPRWSPDGRYLLALPADETALMLFDVKTGKWRTLFKGLAAYPCWSHDGQFIYFLHVLDPAAVERVAVPSGNVEQVVSLKGYPFTGFYTFWFGLAPDDSPLLLKDVGTQEVVSMKWASP